MISLFRKFLENRLSIWIILLFGLVLIFYLYDLTLQTDPYSWLRTAENLFGSGETGTQHRNILFSYLLSIPYFLNINPVYFAGGVGRQIMGTGVIGGMLAASVIAIFLIPVSFYVVQRLSRRRQEHELAVQQADTRTAMRAAER